MSMSLGRISRRMKPIVQKTAEYWVAKTPIRTGNARSSTRLSGNTIYADYEYAVPLDRGHSKQAPRGMSEPTQRYFDRLVRQAVRK
jgi:hypothetical protein